jgi:hypothetical protein
MVISTIASSSCLYLFAAPKICVASLGPVLFRRTLTDLTDTRHRWRRLVPISGPVPHSKRPREISKDQDDEWKVMLTEITVVYPVIRMRHEVLFGMLRDDIADAFL